MDNIVQRARLFATQAHRRINHRRKYTKQPYEVHLKRVAALVSSVTDDGEVIAAAWLHDTVEDTPATFQDLEVEFGLSVAQLVAEVTDVSRPSDGNRARRKAIDRSHLSHVSPEAKTVKLADIIDNCRDICRNDQGFAKVFVSEAFSILEILTGGDSKLYEQAKGVINKCARQLKVTLRGSLQESDSHDPTHAKQIFLSKRSQRLFTEIFSAKDIAEPLPSFDRERSIDEIMESMSNQDIEVAGIREHGTVRGYISETAIRGDQSSSIIRRFAKDQVIEGDASLTDVIQVLTRHAYCFVTLLGSIDGVIMREDIQKPVVRMWLFGMITIVETGLAGNIRHLWPNGEWRKFLSKARISKAEKLLDERRRRRQHCDLLECLQLSDKAQILMEDPLQLKAYGFDTKGAATRVIKELESLRNNLAHAQDIVTHDWPQIARMTHRVEMDVSEV